jgi:hypothetical protein
MEAAKEDGIHVGRPATPDLVKEEIRRLARETDLSIRKIKAELESGPLAAEVSRGVVGRVVKKVRSAGSKRAAST